MKNILILLAMIFLSKSWSQNNYFPTPTGNVGINVPNPAFPVSPLHVKGGGTFSALGWQKAITISNHGTLAFSNAGTTSNSTFFMGAPAQVNDFYFGTVPNVTGGSSNGPVVYAFKVFSSNSSQLPAPLGNPGSREQASTQFYTNTYIQPSSGDPGYFGVNTLEPIRVGEFKDASPQLRLTSVSGTGAVASGLYTDFHTSKPGLNITPKVNAAPLVVFIHNDAPNILTQRSFDVNGNARFRYVPLDQSSESLILGKTVTQSGDVELRRLDFTGNANDVLLGDGTWGTATNQANNGLSIDPTGTYVQLGNDYNLTTAQFLNNREIPMNNFNLVFTDGSGQALTNSIGVGTNAPLAKMHIVRNLQTLDNSPIAFYVQHNDVSVGGPFTAQAYGVKSEITGPNRSNFAGHFFATGAKVNYGIWSEGNSANTNAPAVGIYTTGSGGSVNVGVVAVASPNSVTANGGFNAGIQSTAYSGLGNAYGGKFTASSSNVTANALYGIYASTTGTATGANYAGFFNGPIMVSTTTYPSDQNMKTNIVDYDSSMYVISQLNPKTFQYTNANYQGMNLPQGHQYGLIAQEVEQIIPAVVSQNIFPAQYDSLGNIITPAYNFKGVDYTKLIPVLIGGIQEQQDVINTQDSLITDLNERLLTLENCLSNLLPELCELNEEVGEGNGNSDDDNSDDDNDDDDDGNHSQVQNNVRSVLNIELTNGESIVLEQNVPNPFAEQTVINYSIPESIDKAQIHFYNQDGKIIKTIEITSRGKGQINVFGSDLSSGIYTYTLVADGQVVATKRMVKTN